MNFIRILTGQEKRLP